MNRVFKTVLVPLDVAPLLQSVAALSGAASLAFGWSSPALSSAGVTTHYIFCGMMLVEEVEKMENPSALKAALRGIADMSDDDAASICAAIHVSDDGADEVLLRHQLVLPGKGVEDGNQ